MIKLKSKQLRKILVSSIFLFLIIIFHSILVISQPMYGKTENVAGYQLKGSYSSNEGMVQYRFENNLNFNISASHEVNYSLEFSKQLRDHSFGINITAKSPNNMTNFTLYADNQFKYSLKGKTQYLNNNNIPGKNPNSPRAQNIIFSNRRSDSDSDISNTEYSIELYREVYYHFSISSGVEELEIFYDLSSNEKFNHLEELNVSWAYYDRNEGNWYLLESTIDPNGYLKISLNAQEDVVEYILQNDQITIAPVIFTHADSIWDNNFFKFTIITLLTLIGIFGLLMTNQEYRAYLINRVVNINKSVHQNLTIKDVLENENRNIIIDYILDNPGAHFNEIQEKTDVNGGNLAWHLDVLETFKVIRKIRIGQYLTYFPYYSKNPISKINLKLQKSKTTLQILQLINDSPGIYQNKIALRLDLNHKTVKYHLDKLLKIGVILSDKRKRKKGFYPMIDPE